MNWLRRLMVGIGIIFCCMSTANDHTDIVRSIRQLTSMPEEEARNVLTQARQLLQPDEFQKAINETLSFIHLKDVSKSAPTARELVRFGAKINAAAPMFFNKNTVFEMHFHCVRAEPELTAAILEECQDVVPQKSIDLIEQLVQSYIGSAARDRAELNHYAIDWSRPTMLTDAIKQLHLLADQQFGRARQSRDHSLGIYGPVLCIYTCGLIPCLFSTAGRLDAAVANRRGRKLRSLAKKAESIVGKDDGKQTQKVRKSIEKVYTELHRDHRGFWAAHAAWSRERLMKYRQMKQIIEAHNARLQLLGYKM